MTIERTKSTSSQIIAARVDDRGRITIPKEVREALDIREGDTCFFDFGENYFRVVRGKNPFDILAQDASEQDKRGETISFDDAFEQLARIDPDTIEISEVGDHTVSELETDSALIVEVKTVMRQEHEEMMRRLSERLEGFKSDSGNITHE